MMRTIEKTGRTVEEAIRQALAELGVERDAVDVEVLDEGSKGLFGLLGARQARVRVTVKDERLPAEGDERDFAVPFAFDEDDEEGAIALAEEPVDAAARAEAIEKACAFIRGVAERLGLEVGIETREDADNIVYVNVTGCNLGLLIGRHGETLNAVQFLANVVANRDGVARVRLVLDAEGYRARREAALRNLARRTAERVAKERRKAALEPMNALERRIIHLALKDHEHVVTYSEGEEPFRRVIIAPK